MADTYYSDYFRYTNGHLYCEKVKVKHLVQQLAQHGTASGSPVTPFFLYSKSQIQTNIDCYRRAMEDLGLPSQLNFSMKANMNPAILKLMWENDCSLTLVSGMELQLALKVGFEPEKMVLNGNGKQDWEIKMAVENGCLLNIDSPFNCHQMIRICQTLRKGARVLLRVNPNIHVEGVHQYNNTGKDGCKFGVDASRIPEITDILKGQSCLELVGLHCHLGSTIDDSNVFRRSAEAMMTLFNRLRSEGFQSIQYLNLGGGLGIQYTRHKHRTQRNSVSINGVRTVENPVKGGHMTHPTAANLLAGVVDVLKGSDVKLILEPGRSLVGNAAVLVTSALGTKKSGNTNFVVVDGAMTEVIRPSLYSAYHHIDLAEPSQAEDKEPCEFHVVGPVCESGDFLGKERLLVRPHEQCLLAVFDVGAYCSSMASNYNMRPRPAEILVNGDDFTVIRKRESLDDLLAQYTCGL